MQTGREKYLVHLKTFSDFIKQKICGCLHLYDVFPKILNLDNLGAKIIEFSHHFSQKKYSRLNTISAKTFGLKVSGYTLTALKLILLIVSVTGVAITFQIWMDLAPKFSTKSLTALVSQKKNLIFSYFK